MVDDQKRYLVVITILYRLMKLMDKIDYDILYDLIYELSVFTTNVIELDGGHKKTASSIMFLVGEQIFHNGKYSDSAVDATEFHEINMRDLKNKEQVLVDIEMQKLFVIDLGNSIKFVKSGWPMKISKFIFN